LRGLLKDFVAETGDGIVGDIHASLLQKIGDGAERSLFAAQLGDALFVRHERLKLTADSPLVASDSGIESLRRWLRRGSVSHLTAS
jgi:hypothetical protein